MREQKKGEKGIAAAYMTRNKALRKLQLSLKDFRRLCILKGIFPRDPKKKKYGKDKTYYHVKDIKFLAHEPLLRKFREFKTFLKKRKKALHKEQKTRLEQLEKNKPVFTFHHLVKERYPTFVDALRELDDPLSMLCLFAALPTTTRDHKPEMVAQCTQLVREWESYVLRTKSLRKVFISVKGIYYQAQVQGQAITWLSPHKFAQVIPADVDIKIMLTFFEFYLTMVKFINFKLYHDIGLQYPPKVDQLALAKRAGLAALRLETRVPALTDGGEADEEEEGKLDDFSAFDESNVPPEELERQQYRRLFKGLKFVLARETPLDSLEFILLSGSAEVAREDQLSPEDLKSPTITHVIMDRPTVREPVPGRHYVQPQWVFDSFNSKALLPVEPYGPGCTPPPHLSPFVDDREVGYVPTQRKVLEQWAGQEKKDEDAEDEGPAEEDEGDESEDEEVAFADGLAKEQAGVQFSSLPQPEEKKAAKGKGAAKPSAPAKRKAEHHELSKIMMNKKDARLYSKIQYGIKQKADQVALLEAKRRKLTKGSKPDASGEAEESD